MDGSHGLLPLRLAILLDQILYQFVQNTHNSPGYHPPDLGTHKQILQQQIISGEWLKTDPWETKQF